MEQLDHRKLKVDQDFVKDLLCVVLKSLGPSFLILDGLDEIEEFAWKALLPVILQIQQDCPESNILLSSRDERDIGRILTGKAVLLRIDDKNRDDIQAFVSAEAEEMLEEVKNYGADHTICSRIRQALDSIAPMSKGGLSSLDRTFSCC